VKGLVADDFGINIKHNFYIQDVAIKSQGFAGTQQSAYNIDFTVVEPYSISNFITMLKLGMAVKSPELDSTDPNLNAMYLLKLEFVGYRNGSDTPEVIKGTTRYWPIHFISIKSSINVQGATYQLQASPVGKVNLKVPANKEMVTMGNSIQASGNNTKEIIEDFVTKVNKQREDSIGDKNYIPDIFEVEFYGQTGSQIVKDAPWELWTSTLSVNPNTELGSFEMENNPTQANGTSKEDSSPKKMVYTSKPGRGIHECIDHILRDSQYMRTIAEKQTSAGQDLVTLWKIDMEAKFKTYDKVRESRQRVVVIKLYPYKVHANQLNAYFKGPTTGPLDTGAASGLKLRDYYYYYSGKNTDVLSFNAKYESLQNVLTDPTLGIKPDPNSQKTIAPTNGEEAKVDQNAGNTVASWAKKVFGQLGESITQTLQYKPHTEDVAAGKLTRVSDPMLAIQRKVHDWYTSSKDPAAVNLNLEILGDMLYLPSGTSPIKTSAPDLHNNEGSFRYEAGTPYVKIMFYNPSDTDPFGFMTPNATEVSAWSGYYFVVDVESHFKNGVFTQNLFLNKANIPVVAPPQPAKK
jgi:hypothetical protein